MKKCLNPSLDRIEHMDTILWQQEGILNVLTQNPAAAKFFVCFFTLSILYYIIPQHSKNKNSKSLTKQKSSIVLTFGGKHNSLNCF